MKATLTPAKLRAHVAAAKAAGASEVVVEETQEGLRVRVMLRPISDPKSASDAEAALDSWERGRP